MSRPFSPDTVATRAAGLRRDTEHLVRRSDAPWRYAGVDGFADFINGANAAPTDTIPDPVPLRIRLKVGGGLELQGDLTGLAPGDIICNFPDPYRPDFDTPLAGHDDAGNYVPCRFYATGDLVYGVT
jgi:hypothetical protein